MRVRRRSALSAFILATVLLLAVGASLVLAPFANGLLGAWLAALMIAIAAVDARRYIIPNELVAAALLLGLLSSALIGPDAGVLAVGLSLFRALATALPLFLLMIGYRALRGRDGLGLGDVKLAAVAGAWLDWFTIAGVLELAALSAIAAYVVYSMMGRRALSATARLPFGLFLAPAIWLGWLFETLVFL